MKIKNSQANLINDQNGIASMVIVILIMTLLSLIVIGMTQNSNREQRQALDRQLNSQAFFAAESGVADLQDYIANNPIAAVNIKNDCDPISSVNGEYFPGRPSTVGTDSGASYTCVLYNRIPTKLFWDVVDVASSQITVLEDAQGETYKDLTFSWYENESINNFGGCPANTAAEQPKLPRNLSNDCHAGMIRIDLIDPAVAAGREAFAERIFTAYFKPTNGSSPSAGVIDYSAARGRNNQGAIVNGNCVDNKCQVKITNIGANKLYLNMRGIYKPSRVSLEGTLSSSAANIRFRNAQVSVDSTGKANDVVKRIVQSIPVTGFSGEILPQFPVQASEDICKKLELVPSGVHANSCL